MNPTLLRLAVLAGMALCVASLSFVTAAWGAEARVLVSAQASQVRISAEIETTVGRDMAWEVLTDFDHWSEFVPDLYLSRVVSRPGEPLRVEQRGKLPWLPNFPLVVLAEVELFPQHLIRFQRIAGNIRALSGEWHIAGKFPVRLLYRSSVDLGFPLPPQITEEFFRQDAQARLKAMAGEMARRAAAAPR